MANLYKVLNAFGTFYTVASNFGEAQKNIESYLQENDFGYSEDRNTTSVEIVAAQNIRNNLAILVVKKEK